VLGSNRQVRVWAYPLPADLRKSYDGLFALVKSHYGSRSLRGTHVAAVFYSLLETCRRSGVDPVRYLRIAAQRALDVDKTVPLHHNLDSY